MIAVYQNLNDSFKFWIVLAKDEFLELVWRQNASHDSVRRQHRKMCTKCAIKSLLEDIFFKIGSGSHRDNATYSIVKETERWPGERFGFEKWHRLKQNLTLLLQTLQISVENNLEPYELLQCEVKEALFVLRFIVSCASLSRSGMACVTRDHTVLAATFTAQPQSVIAFWLVLISRPAKVRRLSWPGLLGEILRWTSPVCMRRGKGPGLGRANCHCLCFPLTFPQH